MKKYIELNEKIKKPVRIIIWKSETDQDTLYSVREKEIRKTWVDGQTVAVFTIKYKTKP